MTGKTKVGPIEGPAFVGCSLPPRLTGFPSKLLHPPDFEIVGFGVPSGLSPPEKALDKVGGFAPDFFRWPGGRGGAAWTPKSTISCVVLISGMTWVHGQIFKFSFSVP